METLTFQRYMEIVTFMYRGGDWVKGTSTVPSTNGWRLGLKTYLMRFAPYCAFCGMDDATEILHIAPAGKGRFGWTPGNVGAGCRQCNEIASDSVIPWESILYPEWIPAQWPDREECQRIGTRENNQRMDRLIEKQRIRGLIH